MTPLHWAVENGHTNVVNLLLKHDASTHHVDKVLCLVNILLSYNMAYMTNHRLSDWCPYGIAASYLLSLYVLAHSFI